MSAPRPYTLIAEVTHRCPLACPYCSNPLALVHDELPTAAWERVLEDAEALGVMQVHFTGGEPLARRDLEVLVARAHALGLYTNLVTSGIPATRERLAALRDAGVDHVQVSIQSARAERADAIADYPGHARKLDVLGWVKDLGLPLTLNCVLHAGNLDEPEAEIDKLVALAEETGADRLELANTQYVAWALANREALLPSREQLEAAGERAAHHKQRLAGRIDVLFVKPDYFGTTPKACMDGWARRFIHVSPDGTVLPCHAASAITTLHFESVADRPLAQIWHSSPALEAFRGEAWMPEPCASCDRKAIDFGGCRCQAFALTGDAAATDPACARSPQHQVIDEARLSRGRSARGLLRRGRSSARSREAR
ncbi:MAG TPA: pyrroloquinoline quinone biosynthesis protein PqqE [Kofleriaceae bacterium]|nr:pyrroloquinoline quinone biosynthesis protein PqqE [Kofleriaceae bacterium]